MGNVTFINSDGDAVSVEATPGATIMQIATSNGVSGIVAECGGSMSCATCHVYVDESWVGKTGKPSDGESAMLEFAEEPGPNGRLSCQIPYSDELDGLIVRVPENQ
jgi:2Fe-2S ferredoxin